MTKVGAYEAKTRLSELLERVARGDRIVITKHGRPVAVLSPASAQASPGGVVAQIKAFRQGRRLKPLRIREMIEEGRR